MQKEKKIIIQRQSLESDSFTAFTEREHQIVSSSGGKLHFYETSFNGLQFIRCNYALPAQEHLFINIEKDVLEMHFRLEGGGKINRKDDSINLKQGYNMLTLQNNSQQEVWMDPTEKGHFYEIRIGISHFEKLMENFYEAKTPSFTGKTAVITPEMYAVIYQLTNLPYTGKLKALFLEAKMIELYVMQLQQSKKSMAKVSFSLKQSEKNKIYDAKQFMEIHLDKFVTISQLAQTVGLTERKLMQGFKEFFGTTVHTYFFDLRMETAKHLLLNEDKYVNEVSDVIGYKNSQHFIAAFKKKYGISPGKLKN